MNEYTVCTVHICLNAIAQFYFSPSFNGHDWRPWMKEVRDNTSRKGGLPMLPSLYLSTFQPSQRGFFRVHVCKGRESWRKHI
jgi:hypothetical protein